jgi:hypothetical protein
MSKPNPFRHQTTGTRTMSFTDLPAVNAGLNSLSTLLLLAGFIFIKRGNKLAHQKCMIGALVTSMVFLVVLPDVSLQDEAGLWRGAHEVCGAGVVSPDLPGDSLHASDRRLAIVPLGFDHHHAGVQGTVRSAQKNRPLDLADLDVCLGDGRVIYFL